MATKLYILTFGLLLYNLANLASRDAIGWHKNWQKEIKNNCSTLWPVGLSEPIDTTAPGFVKCNCALLRGNFTAAEIYLDETKIDPTFPQLMKLVLGARLQAAQYQDDKAVLTIQQALEIAQPGFLFLYPEMEELSSRNATAAEIKYKLKPGFDVFNIFILLVCFLGIILVPPLYLLSEKRRPHIWLLPIMANFSLIMISFVMYWSGYNFQFPYLDGIWNALYFLIGPLLYLYISALYDESKRKVGYIHFLPFLLILILLYLSNGLFWSPNYVLSGVVALIPYSMPTKLIHMSIYGFLMYSSSNGKFINDNKTNKWRISILGFYALFLAANFVYYLLISHPDFNQKWDYFISFFMALAILGVYYLGWKEAFYMQFKHEVDLDYLRKREGQLEAFLEKPNVIQLQSSSTKSNSPAIGTGVEKYRSSPLTSMASAELKRKVEALMEQNQLFKESNLKIQDLADELQVSKHIVSQVINENFGMGFYEYINQHRLAYALSVMSMPENPYQVSEIAYLSGFNNKVSFYKMFKAKLNTTPTAYMEQFKPSGDEHKKI